MWAVGRYLSRYPVAGVAFEAPSTCKQLTPQITAIYDGAQENTMLYLNTHATCANAPERYMAHTPAKNEPKIATLSLYIALKVLQHIKAHHNASKQHESSLPGNVTARH